MINLSDYDYPFDSSLIAQYPESKRDDSRLFVLNRTDGTAGHRKFSNVIEYLRHGDVLVLNNTRVIPCRVTGEKEGTGGHVELLFLKKHDENSWEALSNRKLRPGTWIRFSDYCRCEVSGVAKDHYIVKFAHPSELKGLFSEIGQMPVPPYIRRESCEEDRERYQTVYALEDGAIAAPTAGLHFTRELMQALTNHGVSIVYITLHVGIGTFRPVKSEYITDHQMENEWFKVSEEAAEHIRQTKEKGGRVIAVGTTSVRALEQAAIDGVLKPAEGETGLFIYPGYKFNIVDAMITNFHLPRSTLFMLVTAFAGRENILNAYAVAVGKKYRFYSYGDAMLII